ncbi:HD-GYP domain-containing protein [Paenibacillus radicis (ex Xue et al. 2023)]|uniref:HD domain-containing protein n=1 Tax=Paenibacillus radicis (ex Xue et al. 2023) TaxID=2972489 RepID=A0ABT1YT94_9BACL|nr:HD domain-containing phosphohydrolase [Paenibacillus radicis (ex Xue et al. 2023)]MCR8636409.1 HD domain-containing protein [Paenibacillus radicis (ex Xue et al. 2023)]
MQMQLVLMHNEMNQLLERDSETYDHSVRVASMAKVMAHGLKLDPKQTYQLVNGCYLHDIGKLRIPMEILNKPSGLAPHEWDLMRLHPTVGANMLKEYAFIDQEIIDVVEFHHERWSGDGYCAGLKGQDIPVFARICSIIDAFDCMISRRSYHRGLTVNEAIDQLVLNAGTQFDKQYVHIFIQQLNLNE